MAERRPLVEIAGEIQELPLTDNLPSSSDVLSRTFTSAAIAGAPQYVDGNGSVDNARANAEGTSQVLGLALAAAGPGTGQIITNGIITLTVGEWDAVAGTTGGLTADAKYFLSEAAAGRLLETTPPSTAGDYIVEVGVALSTTELNVRIRRRILKA